MSSDQKTKSVVNVSDNLVNLVSGLGTDRAKSAHSKFSLRVYSDAELLTTYRENWLAQKVVDIPAQDATREWRNWQADKGQIELLEREEGRLNVREKVRQALMIARLYGGAALYIGASGDPSKPLDIERERLNYVTVIGRQSLTAGEPDLDVASEYFGQPSFYNLTTATEYQRIHPSRLVRFYGKKLPDNIDVGNGINTGWGDSILAACMAPLLRTESTMANAGELVFESQVSVMKIPDLMSQVGDAGYRQSVLDMISLQAAGKGITKMLMIDGAQEYENHSATFAGVPEIINSFHEEMSGASGIPLTRLFGRSTGGLNSTGEQDLRTHYDNIKAMQNLDISPAMYLLDEMIIRSALRSRPDEVHYTWANLWYPTAKEQAEIGKITAETIKSLVDSGLFNSDALSKSATNMLTERGIMPGLEGAMDEFAEEDQEITPENEPTDD